MKIGGPALARRGLVRLIAADALPQEPPATPALLVVPPGDGPLQLGHGLVVVVDGPPIALPRRMGVHGSRGLLFPLRLAVVHRRCPFDQRMIGARCLRRFRVVVSYAFLKSGFLT